MNQSNQLESKREFVASNNKKYKVESIIDSIIYGIEAKNQLLGLNYLVL